MGSAAPRGHAAEAAATPTDPQQAISLEIQKLLAQAGCPGWMTVTAEVAAPVRLPSPSTLSRGDARVSVVLAQLAAPQDELISESEDLLLDSPEVTGKRPADDKASPPAATPSAAPSNSPSSPPGAPGDAHSPTPAPALSPTPSAHPPRRSWSADELLNSDDDLLAPAEALPPPSTSPIPHDDLLHDRDDLLAPEAPQPPATVGAGPVPSDSGAASPYLPAPATATPPHGPVTGSSGPMAAGSGDRLRCEFVPDSLYPAAAACRACHEKIYDQWSVSSHAYAAVSPMFHKFEQKINDLSQGTIGYFCFRCHSPAGTALGVSRAAPMWDAPLVAREGVTCIACHRVREMYGKTNGERRIEPGDIYAPVFGPFDGDGVAAAAADSQRLKVKTSPAQKGPGQAMHATAFRFPQLSRSEFCASCHQVAVYPGIKLEVVWEQYRASPACKKGVSCHDCHMGRIPGVPSGYESGPAALIDGKQVTADRKHSNHMFYGPGYSIAHPGVFPFNAKAERWSMRDWLLFDWRAGWGQDAFEDAVAAGVLRLDFPDPWKESDDRCDAREIIDANLRKKALKDRLRLEVMENGSRVDGPYFDKPRRSGDDLDFHYVVANLNDGHNLPTASLGAQPQLWANVVLIGPDGRRVWETGYLDQNGDLADIHSEEVRHKRLEFDWQLFNLQTMFLITGAKGTDREFFLPLNIDVDPLPFIRPAPQPVSVINHPPFIRMEARSLAPLGARRVPYRVPGRLIAEPGRYRLSFRMRSRTEPPYFMRFCGSTLEMQRAMIEGTLDFHQSSVEFDVD